MSNFGLLSYLGACHPEAPYVVISKVSRVLLVILVGLYKVFWAVPYSGGVFYSLNRV